MSNLTIKQRAKVNACLAIIHARSRSIDVGEVIAMAGQYKASGMDERKSFELAINAWAAAEPELAATVSAFTRLIEASDDKTVATYDQALNTYIAGDGDEAALNALAPMLATDGQAFAQSLGGDEASDMAAGFALLAPAQPEVPASAPAAVNPIAPASPQVFGPSNGGPNLASPQGQMSATTAAKWAEAPIQGVQSGRDPYAHMTPQQAYEACKNMPHSGAILPVVAPVIAAMG